MSYLKLAQEIDTTTEIAQACSEIAAKLNDDVYNVYYLSGAGLMRVIVKRAVELGDMDAHHYLVGEDSFKTDKTAEF